MQGRAACAVAATAMTVIVMAMTLHPSSYYGPYSAPHSHSPQQDLFLTDIPQELERVAVTPSSNTDSPSFSDIAHQCSHQSDDAKWVTGGLATKYTAYHVEPSPVCMMGNSFFHFGDGELPFPHMNTSAVMLPLRSQRDLDDARSRHMSSSASSVSRGSRGMASLHFHPVTAVMLTVTWNSVNWYHLLMDQLLGLSHMDLAYPEFRNHPRRVVHVINSTWNTKWGKSDQEACFAFSSSYSSDGARSIAVRATQEDATMHCFCRAAVVREHVLPRGEPTENFASPQRHAAMAEHKQRMVRHFNELPYGQVATTAQYTRLGYWKEGSDPSVPRMLFVNRKKRRIGNADRLVALAKEVGFNVAVVYFESLTPAEQYHLSRYADVLVGIHGMALTYVANMDGTGSFARCRTLIELMHWVKPARFWYYEEMAPLNDIVLDRVLPVDVDFGPSVRDKVKEKRLLMRNVFWWGLKGFDDQIAFFDTKQVRGSFTRAMERWRQCSTT